MRNASLGQHYECSFLGIPQRLNTDEKARHARDGRVFPQMQILKWLLTSAAVGDAFAVPRHGLHAQT